MNMKTWTNPTVEELEVKMTADWSVTEHGENWDIGNGKLEGPFGTPETGKGS